MLVTRDNLSSVLTLISRLPEAAIDVETTGFHPWSIPKKDVLVGVSLYQGTGSGFYFPFRHSNSDNLTDSEKKCVLEAMSEIKVVRNHNFKFDLNFMYCEGYRGEPEVWDSQHGLYLMDETKSKALKLSAKGMLGDSSDSEEEELNKLLMSWGYGKDEMWRLPAHLVAPYGIKDTVLAWDMVDLIKSKLSPTLISLWKELNRLTIVAHKMEVRGVPISMDKLERNNAEALKESSKLFLEIKTLSGGMCIPSSPKSIATFLRTPDAKYETLKPLEAKNPIIGKIVKYSEWSKGVNTYYTPYKRDWIASDNRIHANNNITGARSGRWSVKDPNMQQMPRYCETQKVKDIICADEDYSLVEIDYSQAEIRLAAHYTQDKTLIQAIKDGKDIHQFVADEANITRQHAKTINFATIYGAGALKVAEQLGVSETLARKFLGNYNARFPGYKLTSQQATKKATEQKFVTFWNGRRRHYDSPDEFPHTAFNQIIQGGVAQMVNRTVVALDRILPEESGMILQLHDAVYFHMPTSMVSNLVPEIKKIMETQPQFSVPMTVDVKVGKSLGSMKKYEVE